MNQPTPLTDYSSLRNHRRIVILTDGYSNPFVAKTGISILRYRTADVVGVIDKEAAGKTAQELLGVGGNIPVVDGLSKIGEADSLHIGIAPPGGKLPSEWRPLIIEALRRKLDIVSGLHDFLTEDDEYIVAAKASGSELVDVRKNRYKSTAQCVPFRSGSLRVHSVGHDCSIGKMVTTVEIERAMKATGLDAKFVATGQTGIMISGEGVPVDCVVSDFINGAIEELVKRNDDHDYLLIEGQGSISHPAYSAVTAGLLHGCAPHGLIFCYEAGRKQVKGFNNIDIPPMKKQIEANLVMANLRHPCKLIGFAINSRHLTLDELHAEIGRVEDEFQLPACDVYRTGAEKLVRACVQLRNEVFPT